MSGPANPQTLLQSWNVPEVKKRLQFVLFALLIFVVCTHIPAPGVDRGLIDMLFQRAAEGGGGLLDLLNSFSGGALQRFSILALGVMPYINASIMMQLLVAIEPKLKEMQQEGEEGRKKISKWTRYLAVFLAFLQGTGLLISITPGGLGAIMGSGATMLGTLTALGAIVGGTCFLMWLGDEISNKGVGNGVSLIIMLGIIAIIPAQIIGELSAAGMQSRRILALLMLLVFAIVVVTAIVFIQLSSRKIPVQYARRQIGRRVYGGQSTYLPLRLTQAGVIPIIFAISVIMVPQTIVSFLPNEWSWVPAWKNTFASFGPGGSKWWLYVLVEFGLVFLFTFVYTAVTFSTQDIADNLKKNNGFIPGIRPGKPTFEFLDRVLHRVTFFGASFLSLVAILPILINVAVDAMFAVQITSFWIGGTSLLIVVGVALDTVQQMQAHMVMRHYSGFQKK